MTLHEIADAVGGTLNQESEISICEISTDTRKITKGCLYLALKGERFDGHDFIDKAFELGASAVISSKKIEKNAPVIMVKDTRLALGKLASYYKQKHSVFTVGVTGSVGKTSTKEMIATVLSKKYCVHKTQGNFNNDIGLPMTLLGIESKHSAVVIEMGMSALGEIHYLSQITMPDVAVITNVGVSHMENLGSRENILKAKLEILDGLKPDGKVVLNADNDMLQTVPNDLKEKAIWFGIENQNGMVYADSIIEHEDTTAFEFVYQGKRYPAVLPLIGIHNVYNALAGFCVGMLVGLTPENVVEAIKTYRNSGMRQSMQEYDGIKVVADCYNASPDSMRSALDVIQKVTCQGKRFAVFGDMLELGTQSKKMHYQVGVMAAGSKLDGILCYGAESAEMARAAKEHGMKLVVHATDKDAISNWLKNHLHKGDCVIFKASRGMKLEEIIQTAFVEAGGLSK